MEKGANQADDPRTFGGLHYSTKRNIVVDHDDHPVSLRPKTLDVFRLLSDNHDTVVSREYMLATVWADVIVTDDSLTKCIAELRKALGPEHRDSLKTISKRGYTLVADTVTQSVESSAISSAAILPRKKFILAGIVLFLFGLSGFMHWQSTQSLKHHTQALVNKFAPTTLLQVSMASESSSINPALLHDELSLALSRYKTIQLVERTDSDYNLQVIIREDAESEPYVKLSLHNNKNGTEVFTELVTPTSFKVDLSNMAARISALIASPATGAIGRELLANGRRKPVDTLSRAECYAHGYDCTNCSGELDSIDTRSQTCLSNILAEDENDVRAWSLQSTSYAKQFQWSTNLGEPQRTNVQLRREIVDKAISAANRAEQLSDGTDSSVYWGMAQAYLAACDVTKMQTAIDRGLQINPNDPGLLATFGNWVAYSGQWDLGVAMVDRALILEPKHYKRWWLFAIAKRHYIRGEHQQALDIFYKAFNERNWLSHLQLAYTLPYLNRIEEAKAAADKLQFVFPGITVEVALQLYKSYCFPDEYLEKMKTGLMLSGLPERGDSSDVNNIIMPMTKIIELDNWDVEYMDLGQGTPVLFVHGAMSDYRSWAHYQNPISAKYRYISYSRRYHGSQAWKDDGQLATISQHVADLEKFIEHLALKKLVLVTWSSGGAITTALALKRPDLVKGIVAYEPNTLQLDDQKSPSFPTVENERFMSGFKRIFDLLDEGQAEQATKAFMETVFEKQPGEFETELMAIRRVVLDNARTVRLSFSANGSPDLEINCEDLANMKIPALVLAGEHTPEIWQYRARRFVECAPSASFQPIAGTNHAGPIRVPAEVFKYIDQFIESL